MIDNPKGMSDYPEQLRPPIPRGIGTTDSERYLAKLADRSFLNLWSYPNPYRDQRAPGITTGKELCDLLVVCGRHVIIFSEKTIRWPDKPLDVAWPRWFKKAIWGSAGQIRGAERWIVNYPHLIFMEPECRTPFPLSLPGPSERVIHRVIVAQGATEACRGYRGYGNGSLAIKPAIRGEEHFNPRSPAYEPFCIGDVDPVGSFVHVLNEASLDVIMSELDTVTDFTSYLEKKEVFVRSGRLIQADTEEDLVAYYAIRINDEGDHDFTSPRGEEWGDGETVTINAGRYAAFSDDPRYMAKKRADQDSYVWDRLIETFTEHILAGTSIVLEGYKYNLKHSEIGLRYMALERRFRRRGHGKAIIGALERGRESGKIFPRNDPAGRIARKRHRVLHPNSCVREVHGEERLRQLSASPHIYCRHIC